MQLIACQLYLINMFFKTSPTPSTPKSVKLQSYITLHREVEQDPYKTVLHNFRMKTTLLISHFYGQKHFSETLVRIYIS